MFKLYHQEVKLFLIACKFVRDFSYLHADRSCEYISFDRVEFLLRNLFFFTIEKFFATKKVKWNWVYQFLKDWNFSLDGYSGNFNSPHSWKDRMLWNCRACSSNFYFECVDRFSSIRSNKEAYSSHVYDREILFILFFKYLFLSNEKWRVELPGKRFELTV